MHNKDHVPPVISATPDRAGYQAPELRRIVIGEAEGGKINRSGEYTNAGRDYGPS